MSQVKATRNELIAHKTLLKVSNQGKDLLKKKNDVLIAKFMEVMQEVLKVRSELEKAAAEANYAHVLAKAVDGRIGLASASFATSGKAAVDLEEQKIMGVTIPQINRRSFRRSIFSRGYSPTSISSRIEQVAETFEKEVDAILVAAEVESQMKRLATEIKKTRRRVNALDYLIIPGLKQDIKYITLRLNEREREELYRLKKVKQKLARNK